MAGGPCGALRPRARPSCPGRAGGAPRGMYRSPRETCAWPNYIRACSAEQQDPDHRQGREITRANVRCPTVGGRPGRCPALHGELVALARGHDLDGGAERGEVRARGRDELVDVVVGVVLVV